MSSPGLAGVTIELASGAAVSLDRAPGGLRAMRRERDGTERAWIVMGASRGEGGILGEGVRQALLRDPTYRPALQVGRGDGDLGYGHPSGGEPGGRGRRDAGRGGAAGGHIVLTGGSTPKLAYETASRAGVDWSRATVWFSDERCVPPEDGLSNFRMANDALIGRLNKDQRPTVMRMEGELGPDAGSAAYEASVREHLGGEPRWDLLLLGLGPDAHTRLAVPGQAGGRGALGGWSRASSWPAWSRRCRGSR